MEGEIGKKVGWYPREVFWPSNMEEVEAAGEEQLIEWYRFLPSASSQDQEAMIARIIARLFPERGRHG